MNPKRTRLMTTWGLVAMVLSVIWSTQVFAAETMYYFKNSGEIKDAQQFMKLRGRLGQNIRDEERRDITFALGEYYFKNHVYRDAEQGFREHLQQNPVGVTALLANVYLYKLGQINHHEEEAQINKEEIFKDPFILLFNKFKTITYTSLFDNIYEIHYYVDKIEIFLNGYIFAQIEP